MVGVGQVCPSEETIVAFAEGRLAPDEVTRVERHTLACEPCRDLVAVALGTGALAGSATGAAAFAVATTTSVGRGTAAGRYTILARVGRGGMGDVYAAFDPRLDRKVALKLIRADGGRDSARVQARLLLEAKALAKLAHPNVVAVHDAGTFHGRVFIAMEFVDGVTMRDWLAARPRAWRDILEVFVKAARGLAAAHAAGLVHRDFKPTNVMIAADGSVRVMDFGLARPVSEERDEPAPRDAPLGPLHLTRTGERLGTPLYMAPEQFTGAPTDARTDQFSFCVALHQALLGSLPFKGDTIADLMANVLAGRVEPAPARSAIPAWLLRVVLRGLSVGPEARWPSMGALVAALGHDPARARRRLGSVVGALAIVALLGAALARSARPAAPLCLAGPARLAGAWEPPGVTPHPTRDAIERAFLASDRPGAADVWQRVAVLLDRYAGLWLSSYRDACEATNVRHDQPTAVLDLRMGCLEERRTALAALTAVLVQADRDVVARAVDGANALPPLERCADVPALQAAVEPPSDATTRARVEDLRVRAAKTKALNDTGKHLAARPRARAQIAEARVIGYKPLLAEALDTLAETYFTPNFAPEGTAVFEEGIEVAIAARRDDLAAELATTMAFFVSTVLDRPEEGRQWSALARTLLDRLGSGHDRLRAWFLHDQGVIELQRNPKEALASLRAALALKQKTLPPDHPDTTTTMASVADALHTLGRNAEAITLTERAYVAFVRAYGPVSIEAAYTLSNQGEYMIEVGRAAEAVAVLESAAAIWEGQSSATEPNLGFPLTALGRALLATGRASEAVAPLTRALALRERGEHSASLAGETRFALARALWEAKAQRARAFSLAATAGQEYLRDADAAHAAAVEAWLASHGAPPTRRRSPPETAP